MKSILCVLLTSLAVVLTACNKSIVSTGRPGFEESRTLSETHPRVRLVVGSVRLAGTIRVANTAFRKVGQFTQAQLGIQNTSGSKHNLEYKVEWENEDGFMVDQSDVWRPAFLGPHEIYTVVSTGKVPEAYKIVFTVRLISRPE